MDKYEFSIKAEQIKKKFDIVNIACCNVSFILYMSSLKK